MTKTTVEVITTKPVYVAEDGKEFATETECLAYEESLKKPTVNEMLWAALFTESKKRKVEYQAELEALGYKISKDGAWYISKGSAWIRRYYDQYKIDTWKGRCIQFGYYQKSSHWRKGHYHSGKYTTVPKSKINLVGILNAEPTYHDYFYKNYWNEDYSDNITKLKYALRDRRYASQYLDLASETRDETIAKAKEEYERAIKNANEHYEWTIRCYTKDLERANETINSLLKRN